MERAEYVGRVSIGGAQAKNRLKLRFSVDGGIMAQQRTDKGFRRRPKILDQLGAGDEAQAREYAETLVRDTRSRTGRVVEGSAPDPDEVRERRESRQSREAHQES